jgi:hypothetical protein
MSSGGNPPLSPFVRGTTDTTHVFFLQSGGRRPIPDDATLKFMLAGQTVRVLSDADLAAIPLGTALPSRADGTLLTQKFTAPPPGATYYLMTAGQRRRVPDLATTLILTRAQAVIAVELADLTAIPEGPALPTRADNTLYRGTAGAFAYILAAGQKRAFPNATTLRDAGHDITALIPISDADATLMPNGAPFPSTSRFLSPPSADVPLILLPMRLETRFQGSELWLRVYPDDVHINSFEPQLTSDEQSARTAYLAQAKTGPDAAKAAFGALARQYGAARAAWIASSNVPDGEKSAQWTVAPFSDVLPERWIVIGYMGNAAGQVLAVGPVIQDKLQVGPAPTSSGPLSDPGMKWVTDFNSAIQAGMAFRITLTPEQQRGFNRVVVLGLKTGLSAKDSAARLGDLLQAHHYTDGLELLALNTPTNNTEDVNAGNSSKTDYDALFALEQGPSLCPSRPTADGDRLAAALNIAPALLSHVGGANGAQDEIAQAMNTLMWPATWGYYLSQIVNGAVPNPDVILPAARDHFAAAVRARGHFRILRIGRQPYGLLPVCWSAQWKSLEGRTLDAPLAGLLAKMRTTWVTSMPNVPRIPGSRDPEASLAGMLGMTATTSTFAARNVVGPEYNFSYWDFVQKDLAKTWWTALAQKSLADTSDLSAVMANTRLANSVYVKQQRSLTNVLIAPEPLDGLAAPTYIAQLAGMGWQLLRDVALPGAPIPLFFLLLRHAALRQYMDTALDLLTTAGAAQPDERIEAELLGFSAAIRPTAWDLLARTLPGKGAVGTFLDGARNDATIPAFAAFWSAVLQLSGFSAADLDAAAREALDLASYRLDAWITSLAYFRLESLRAANPNGGIVLGAYGWLENVRPQQQQAASAGFVHAPSLNQSTTAAVLRSGYLAHSDATQRPFEIDLSSGKVRLAMHLLEGIREGQPLGALLGYRLERTMHDLGLDALIDDVRTIAPMQGATNDLDVVDGLVLLQKFQDPSFWNHAGLPAAGTPQRTSLTTAITRLNDALDSAADLALAESVHQLVRGNLPRAGATLDSIARGDTPPADVEVVNTPRSGTALGYRLMTIAPVGAAAGWSSSPRAQAEPRLNAWSGAVLGNPQQVRIRAQFADAQGAALNTVEIGLDQLGLAPLDVLSLPEAEGVSQELSDRIRRFVWKTHPAAAAAVRVLTDRDPGWKPQVVALTEWLTLVQAVSRLVNGARPLAPEDLVVQDDSPGTMDTAELATRANAAENQMRTALTSLKNTSGNDAALTAAAAFGVPGAVPNTDSTKWAAQIASALADLSQRASQLDQLAAGFTRASATPKQSYDFDSARLKIIFGGAFQTLPMLAQGTSDLWANSPSLQANDPLEAVRWFQRAARVRPGAARLDTAAMLAEALSGQLLLQFKVAQLPVAAGDKWVALAGSTSSSRLSMVAFVPGAVTAGAPITGLMIDEWTEVLPSRQQITGVSFQYTDPVARPPQSILLAIKPDGFPEWTMEAVEGSVLEALELAKIRAVDPDSLGALGHYLPALYFAYNTGAPKIETVSIDFNAVLKANHRSTL